MSATSRSPSSKQKPQNWTVDVQEDPASSLRQGERQPVVGILVNPSCPLSDHLPLLLPKKNICLSCSKDFPRLVFFFLKQLNMLPNLCTLVEAMVCGKTWNHKVLSQLCLGSDEKLSWVATRGLESTGPHEGAMLRER